MLSARLSKLVREFIKRCRMTRESVWALVRCRGRRGHLIFSIDGCERNYQSLVCVISLQARRDSFKRKCLSRLRPYLAETDSGHGLLEYLEIHINNKVDILKRNFEPWPCRVLWPHRRLPFYVDPLLALYSALIITHNSMVGTVPLKFQKLC